MQLKNAKWRVLGTGALVAAFSAIFWPKPDHENEIKTSNSSRGSTAPAERHLAKWGRQVEKLSDNSLPIQNLQVKTVSSNADLKAECKVPANVINFFLDAANDPKATDFERNAHLFDLYINSNGHLDISDAPADMRQPMRDVAQMIQQRAFRAVQQLRIEPFIETGDPLEDYLTLRQISLTIEATGLNPQGQVDMNAARDLSQGLDYDAIQNRIKALYQAASEKALPKMMTLETKSIGHLETQLDLMRYANVLNAAEIYAPPEFIEKAKAMRDNPSERSRASHKVGESWAMAVYEKASLNANNILQQSGETYDMCPPR